MSFDGFVCKRIDGGKVIMADKKQEVTTTEEKKELVAKDFTDGLVIKIKEKEKFGLTFPKNYNYTNELMAAMLILQDTVDNNKKPVLQSCTRASIENALLKMATNGLSMQRKQCYPVAYAGKLQCQESVYGNTCIARGYGLKEINAVCIYKGDLFTYHIENAKKIIDKHEQDFENIDNDKIIGAYAVASMNDGTIFTEIMSMPMIKNAWKQGFGYKENGNGTHQKFTDQMCMKTAKNRLLKYINNTYGSLEIGDDEDLSYDEKIIADVEYDIEQNANSELFEPEEVIESEIVSEEVVESEEKLPFEE